MFSLSRHIREMCVFGRREKSNIAPPSIDFQASLPLPAFMSRDAEQAAASVVGHCRPDILPIHSAVRLPQINQPVVFSVPVDVVYFPHRPPTECEQKNNTVPQQVPPPKSAGDVSIPIYPADLRPSSHPSTWGLRPKKNTGFEIASYVFRNGGEVVIGRFSHSVSPYVRGQGRALLKQRFRPVSYTTTDRKEQPRGKSWV